MRNLMKIRYQEVLANCGNIARNMAQSIQVDLCYMQKYTCIIVCRKYDLSIYMFRQRFYYDKNILHWIEYNIMLHSGPFRSHEQFMVNVSLISHWFIFSSRFMYCAPQPLSLRVSWISCYIKDSGPAKRSDIISEGGKEFA